MTTPLFIFSLPRSGSTLLQRMLSQHAEIATTSEPWLLLPLVTMTQEGPSLDCYSHGLAARGINEFAASLPNGHTGFQERISSFARVLYADHCRHGERYFLDKTPRYYWVIDEIAALFPDARFLFLFRHPLQVIASILDTWASGRLHRVHEYRTDIQCGIPLLAEASKKYAARSLCIHYEELVTAPKQHLQSICQYLDIEPDVSVVDRIAQAQVPGQLGDQTGARQYATVTDASCNKWRQTLASPYRQWLIGHWLAPIAPVIRARHTATGRDPLDDLRQLERGWKAWGQVPLDVYDHARSLRKHRTWQTRLRCPKSPAEVETAP